MRCGGCLVYGCDHESMKEKKKKKRKKTGVGRHIYRRGSDGRSSLKSWLLLPKRKFVPSRYEDRSLNNSFSNRESN